MVNIRLAAADDISDIMKWNLEGEAFLKQWSNYEYPLTKQQILNRIRSEEYVMFSIEADEVSVGTIQLLKIDEEHHSARLGCFLIAPDCRGKGIGEEALMLVMDTIFHSRNITTFELGVFDYNKSAIRCYEKCGFVKEGQSIHPFGWTRYHMKTKKWRTI